MVTTDAQDQGPDSPEPGSPDPGGSVAVEENPTALVVRDEEPDELCAAAVELARAAAQAVAEPGTVGAHLGVTAEDSRLVTHRFTCLGRGYRGWHWAITVTRVPDSRTVTVSETVLLPGHEAVLSPVWVPWSERLQPGDLGAADVLPRQEDDPNLLPGIEQVAVDDLEDVDQAQYWELGLGRVRVLGPQGRDAAVERWYSGEHGPIADESVHASAACATCGYFLPLAGRLRQVFGVCANEWSPSDGVVVSVDHGCGAHSETDPDNPEAAPLPEPILDELGAEAVILTPEDPGPQAVADPQAQTEEPAPTEDSASVEEPAAVEDSAPVEEPAPTEDSTPVEEPAPMEEPAPTEEPTPAEDPAPVADETATPE